HIGQQTRFPTLGFSTVGDTLSWTRSGVRIQADLSPANVFARLFLEGTPEQVAAQRRRLRYGQSLLDHVRDQAKEMQAGLGSNDREKLDEYSPSVRDLKKQLANAKAWSKKPKPKVDPKHPQNPKDVDIVPRPQPWSALTPLALQTDPTRLITMVV